VQSRHGDQRERDRHRRRQLVDREEQQVERKRETGGEHRATRLLSAPERDDQQRAQHAGDEQVAVADHRRAEHRVLQARQPPGRVRRVERAVRLLQLF